MKKMIILLIFCFVCINLTGCATWSGNRCMYVKTDSATVFGAWGYVGLGRGSSLLIFDNSYIGKKELTEYFPVPQIQVDPNSNLNIGKPLKYPPSTPTPNTSTPNAIEQAAAIATGNIPLPK